MINIKETYSLGEFKAGVRVVMDNKDYNILENKPLINGVELVGDKTTEDLGIVSKESDPTVPSHVKNITQQNIEGWDNKADKSEIPDVSQFITSTVDNLVNYYNKTETDNKLSAIPKFDIKPVDELPTENISNTSIYLLKVGTDSPTLYEEYIHVNNAWELLGTAKVDLTGYVTADILNSELQNYVSKSDLTDYVKNTDYASNAKHGVVKGNSNLGTYINATKGEIAIEKANEEQILAKAQLYRPIVPNNLDYAVKVGMTTNALEWSNDEKKSARDLIDAVGSEDYATSNKGGVAKFYTPNGVQIAGGFVYTTPATPQQIKDKSNNYVVITPSNIKYAVIDGITNNPIALTAEEKAKAQQWLGIDTLVGDINTELENVLGV